MRSTSYIILMLLIAACTFVLYSFIPCSDYGMKVLGIVGYVQLFFSIFSWKKLTGSALTPYVLFLVSAYVFTFGQSLLFVFDKVTPELDLANMFSRSAMMPAQYLTLIFLNFFHVGGLLSCRKRPSYRKVDCNIISLEEENVRKQIAGVRKIGLFFILLSIIPFIIERFTLYNIVISSGYIGIYMQEVKIGLSNIVPFLSQYFIPGILCLLLTENKKSRKKLFVIILILEACFWLFTGGRSEGVIIASILLMYYHYCVKRIRFKSALIISILGFYFVSLLGVIAETRSAPTVNFLEAFLRSTGSTNVFFAAINEMGGSMFPMITTMEIVPQIEGYRYGSSYLYSFSSVIPNLGFWDLHPAMKYGNLNDWLQRVLNLNYGPGYSIVAEAYINFGEMGFIMMMLLGYVFARIFKVTYTHKRNPLLFVLSFIFCFLVIKTVRNSFLATIRSIFYFIIPIYFFVVYYYKGKINKEL